MDPTEKKQFPNSSHSSLTQTPSQPTEQWKTESRDSGYSRNSEWPSSPIVVDTHSPATPKCVDPKLDDVSTNSGDDPQIYFDYVKTMKKYFEQVSRSPSPSSVHNPRSSVAASASGDERPISPKTSSPSQERPNQNQQLERNISNKNSVCSGRCSKDVESNCSYRSTLSNDDNIHIQRYCDSSFSRNSISNAKLYSELLTDPNDEFKITCNSNQAIVRSPATSLFGESVGSGEKSAPTVLGRRERFRHDRFDGVPIRHGVKTLHRGMCVDPVVAVDYHPLSSSFNIDSYLKENIITEVSLSKDDINSYSSSTKTNGTLTFFARKSLNENVASPKKRSSTIRTLRQSGRPTEASTNRHVSNNFSVKRFIRRIFSSCLSTSNESPTC